MKEKIINIFTNMKFYFVLVSLIALIMTIKYENLRNDFIEENYLQQSAVIDSLKSEIFVKEIELGSYQVMWEILEEVNHPLADSINLIVE